MSRTILTTALLACLSGAACAADAAEHAAAPKAEHAAATAVNAIDPISGKAVDAKIKAVTVHVGDKEILIGVSSQADADQIAKADHKAQELYAKAAQEGKLVKNGKIVDAPKAPAAN